MDMRNAINLCEMSYSRSKAGTIITGFERPLNAHLLKLMVVQASEGDRQHWLKELGTWLREIDDIRLKPKDRPGPNAFYFRILFDEPFGGDEERKVRGRISYLADDYAIRDDVNAADVLRRLKSFHVRLADRCAKGVDTSLPGYRDEARRLLASI